MKATLYEALGILPTSSDEDVRASLRRLIRKYYAKTRDGQGNVEEALRFINHASRILSDPDRRHRYDEELAVSTGTTEQRIAHVVNNAVADAGEQTDVGNLAEEPPRPVTPEAMDEDLETGLDADEPMSELSLHHPGLTERVASFGRSPIVTIGLCALFGTFIASAIAFVTPADTILVAKQVLVWLTITLLALTLVYGVVHGIAFMRRRSGAPQPVLVPQTDLAILNWRREKSVFLGTNQPQEDASWIFQLRMAELERAKSGRTSEAAALAAPRGAPVRLRDLGPGAGAALVGVARPGAHPRRPVLLARPSAHRAHPHHRFVGPDRGVAHRLGGHDARQVAVRRLPAILDFGCVCAARHARATPARAAALVPRLVGRRRVRLSAAGAGVDRRRLREDRAEPGNGLGLRAGRARDARAAGRAQHGDGRLRPGRDVVALWRRMAPADGRVDCVGAHDDRRCVAVGQHAVGGICRRRRADQRQRGRLRPRRRRAFRQRRRRR